MKRISLLLFVASLFIVSCDKIEEANTVDFDTSLSMDIPVSIESPVAMIEKSTTEDFPFSESKTYSLSSNEDISDYLNKVKSIDITDFAIVFSGLGDGEEIKLVDISVTGAGILASFQNVTNANTSPTPTINSANVVKAANILNTTKSIEVTVSGTTNSAPMDFTVNMDFDVHVEANAI